MTYTIYGTTPLDAWLKGGRLLLDNGNVFNLITTIENPTSIDPMWFDQFSPSRIHTDLATLSDVATTIFPYKYAGKGLSRNALYQRYRAAHTRARTLHPKRGRLWGTYFERMTYFGDNEINQLERIILALTTWKNTPSSALVMHTSSADYDSLRPLGAPCLQFIEFLCPDPQTVSLLAVYRNHDFFGKVLGNFIGLGQLLKFVCDETNKTPGTLVCHSAHAYFDSKKDFRALSGLQ